MINKDMAADVYNLCLLEKSQLIMNVLGQPMTSLTSPLVVVAVILSTDDCVLNPISIDKNI